MPTETLISPADPLIPIARPRWAVRLATLLVVSVLSVALLGGCVVSDEGKGARSGSRAAGGALTVTRAELLDATIVGPDTLSDSAYVTGVYPEPDGGAVAFTFADPRRRVSAGLALTQRTASAPALLWPDSVTTVWWSAPHAVAFTTQGSTGIHAVVDVHAERAIVTDDSVARPPAGAGARSNASDPARTRATTYIDSVHLQPAGRPQGSALRYAVTAVRTSPDGRFTAFYAVATDDAGRQANPAWYAMNADGGGITPIDEVVGPLGEMPETAAGWTADGRFVYAKRQTLWEATVRPGTLRPDTVRPDTARQAPSGS